MRITGGFSLALLANTLVAPMNAGLPRPGSQHTVIAERLTGARDTDGVNAAKKATTVDAEVAPAPTTPTIPIMGTLVHTHTLEAVVVDRDSPTEERWNAFLRDRATGESTQVDPRLLGLFRRVLERHPGARIEVVSGYRSPKLNEMMRKKGHHVASHSEHTKGHAVDFRLVLPDAEKGVDPRRIEEELRELSWAGGIGVYTLDTDWFVHADVGRRRRWAG
jgi:uncharacterized protein YcbK (DUF882 family)